MKLVLWDSWAFVETALDGPRREDVEAALDAARGVVTTQHVVAETFTFLAREARSSRVALDWWDDLRASRVRMVEPTLGDVRSFASTIADVGKLSFTDLSLGAAGKQVGAKVAATADREFRRMKIEPMFARA